MRSRRLLLLGLAFGPALLLSAAPPERDLGEGLVLVRVRQLPADLPAKPAGKPPACVVDVRYVQADAETAAAFQAWLRFRATPRSPILVLANRETSPALRDPLARHGRGDGIVVIGAPGPGFTPDVAVPVAADVERRAYDALEEGVPLAKLLADNPEKVRNDEANLSRDRLPDLPPVPAEIKPAGQTAPVLVDATLQRAVHLHRALAALRRI